MNFFSEWKFACFYQTVSFEMSVCIWLGCATLSIQYFSSFCVILWFFKCILNITFWGLKKKPSPGACSNPCPLSQWCHPTISSSVVPFPSSPQSFPTSGSFPVSQLFTSGGQSIRASASAAVLPMNIQGQFSLGLTGMISLLTKGLLRANSQGTSKCGNNTCSSSLLTFSPYFQGPHEFKHF